MYGQLGVELSGLDACLAGVDVEHEGKDSERSFSMFKGSLVTDADGVSLQRCRTLLLNRDRKDGVRCGCLWGERIGLKTHTTGNAKKENKQKKMIYKLKSSKLI